VQLSGFPVWINFSSVSDPARVQEDAAGKLDLAFEDIGEQELKNIARPVRVYRIHLDPFTRPPMVPPGSLVLPDKPSVAVLPFANMSSDPEQEYFADGMVEEIIIALSRYPSLFVIARNSCFTYKGSLHESALSVRHLGRSMNGLRAGMSAPPLMAAARVAAGVTSLTCQEPTFTGPLPNRRSRPIAVARGPLFVAAGLCGLILWTAYALRHVKTK
jgi:hypothetical protein